MKQIFSLIICCTLFGYTASAQIIAFNDTNSFAKLLDKNDEPMQNNEVHLSPNPVKNYLIVQHGQGKMTIHNAMGKLVKSQTIDKERVTIKTSDLPKGQYILRIQRKKGKEIIKQIIR